MKEKVMGIYNMNKKDTLVILGFIICFVAGMFALEFMKNVEIMSDDNLQQIKNDSLMEGYNFAIASILTPAMKCEQVPINVGNQTYNLFLVECLNQGVQNG